MGEAMNKEEGRLTMNGYLCVLPQAFVLGDAVSLSEGASWTTLFVDGNKLVIEGWLKRFD
jgi:hypothetical protein